jgi:moderate conductance mechanosensitive channel
VQINAPECAADAGSVCQWLWDKTGVDVLAAHSDAVVSATVDIFLIVILAIVARFLLYRAINRLTRLTIEGTSTSALRPLASARRAFSRGLSAERRDQRTKAIGSLLKSISSFLVVGTAAVLILAELGIDIAPLLASAGIAGVALAFGAQNLVRDFLAGIFMTLEDQYGVGDAVDLGSASGTVVAVSLRTTTVRAADGGIWHVRNGEILRVGNTSQGEAVVNLQIPIPYDADSARAGAIALEQATEVSQTEEFSAAIIEAPKLLGIVDVAAGVVTIGVSATVRVSDKDAYVRAVRVAVKSAFDRARAEDAAMDFRPPLVTPPGEAG